MFQVSRSTGILSHFVNLNIVIPEAFILGSDEHHVDVGSIINLVCIIEKVRSPNSSFDPIYELECAIRSGQFFFLSLSLSFPSSHF